MSARTPKTRITQLGTVGIPVTDQDRSLTFFRDALGFETRMDASFGDNRWIEVGPPGAETSIALVRMTDPTLEPVDTGIRLTSANAAADHAALIAAGVDVDGEVIPFPVPMFVLRDPDGNALYVVERPGGREEL